MTLREFRRALVAALGRHFPRAKVTIAESRSVTLTCKAELTEDTFIAVYYSALTGKTSYALIRHGQRMTGYDNYRFWHHHPVEAPDDHVPCAEPTPEKAIAELAAVSEKLSKKTVSK
jgi:hypothetical protein